MKKLIRVVLKIVGFALILVGLVAAYYGPLEIYVFYLFSEGGRFHYDGFGMGSIWFAYLVVQNIGYYVIAAICIPIGIGHIKLRRWALTLTQLYIWFWLGSGILFTANLLTLIPQILSLNLSQDILLTRLIIIGVITFFVLIFLPTLALLFYRTKKVSSLFRENDPNTYWTESFPFPLLALLLLYVIIIIVLHTAIFFQSPFPVFGQIIFGRQSVYLISICILILGILTAGIIQLKDWAWWGSLIYLSLLSVSSLISFSQHSFYEIILMMSLPTFEMELLEKLTLVHDFYLVGLVAVPLLAALGLLIYSKQFFTR